ncbi:kinase-like domain-containing protein [Naematelia encephala]|uniref:non-specific serine/threonine protein kinase n=1 Tax=Naematelia encephala TaxID=71784 RepID=A0A1Y2B6D5_9TREE|nr:kinase-like domain-containing protein [Naematelia encephala]
MTFPYYRRASSLHGDTSKLMRCCVDRIMVHIDKVFWIGSGFECDLEIDSPYVSDKHIRLAGVQTPGRLALAVMLVTGRSGVILNDVRYRPNQPFKYEGREVATRGLILRDGDIVKLPHTPAVFTYHHNQDIYDQEDPKSDQSTQEPSHAVQIGKWQISNFVLGTGTFGTVNLAWHCDSRVQVACKTIHVRTEAKEIMDLEIKILRQLNHPGVISLLDTNAEGEGRNQVLHVILELSTGGELWQWVISNSDIGLTEMEIKWFAWQLVSALQYIHSNGVAHRDLKPENILLEFAGLYPRLSVADFGTAMTLSHYTDTLSRHSSAEVIDTVGTPQYFSPEKLTACLACTKEDTDDSASPAKGDRANKKITADQAGDCWALGCKEFLRQVG